MPRLVLLADDGSPLMDIGEVSPQNVAAFARLLQRHRGAISAAAAAVRLGRELLGIAAPPPRRVLRAPTTKPKKRGHA